MSRPHAVFPEPDHDHGRCADDALRHAESVCRARGQKFTPLRRQVLEVMLAQHRALGAYDIIELLARDAPRPAPITVYRALDFLKDNGLVHRIESRNAFIACAHRHDDTSTVAFLICDGCGLVGELQAGGIASALKAAIRGSGFSPTLTVIEVSGRCARCQAQS
jgi:Fur family zinc uptake transcriptional regulator